MFERASPENLSKTRNWARWVQLVTSLLTIICLSTGFMFDYNGGITFGVLVHVATLSLSVYYLLVVRWVDWCELPTKSRMRIIDCILMFLLICAVGAPSFGAVALATGVIFAYIFMIVHFIALGVLIALSCAPEKHGVEMTPAPAAETQPNATYQAQTTPLSRPNPNELLV